MMPIQTWCIKLYNKFKEAITKGTRTKTFITISPGKQETATSQGANSLDITHRVLATLTPLEEKVLRMRFGIGEKPFKTLEDMAKELQISTERLLEIDAKALRKLRHPVRSKKLRSLIDDDPDIIKR